MVGIESDCRAGPAGIDGDCRQSSRNTQTFIVFCDIPSTWGELECKVLACVVSVVEKPKSWGETEDHRGDCDTGRKATRSLAAGVGTQGAGLVTVLSLSLLNH